jgi:hypothetical protein
MKLKNNEIKNNLSTFLAGGGLSIPPPQTGFQPQWKKG